MEPFFDLYCTTQVHLTFVVVMIESCNYHHLEANLMLFHVVYDV